MHKHQSCGPEHEPQLYLQPQLLSFGLHPTRTGNALGLPPPRHTMLGATGSEVVVQQPNTSGQRDHGGKLPGCAVCPRQRGFVAAAWKWPSPRHLAKAVLCGAPGKRVFREFDVPSTHPDQSKPLLRMPCCRGSDTHLPIHHTHAYTAPQHQACKA